MKKNLLLAACFLSAGAVSAQTLLSEDFENGLPGTWSQTTLSSDGGWNAGTAASLSSSFWAIGTSNTSNIVATNDDACNCDKSADYLMLPTLDFSGMTGVVMTFDEAYDEITYGGATEVATVEVSTDGGATWIVAHTVVGTGAGDWEWYNEFVDLGAWDGMPNVTIAIHYNDGGGWEYGMAIDNVNVFVPAPWDAGVSALNIPAFAQGGSSVNVAGTLVNAGVNDITSVDITYDAGAGPVTASVNVSIPSFGSASFTHPTALAITAGTTYTIDVTVSNPNGNADGNAGNDMMTATCSGLSNIPDKMVVGEEATGTWCGWCPRGSDWMEYMEGTYPNSWAGVAVHNGDPMTVAAYDGAMGVGGYPSGHVDRTAFFDVDPSTFESAYQTQVMEIPPAGMVVTTSYNEVTRVLDVTVDATFEVALSGDYRMNVVLTEDHVTGTGSNWGQVNYYNGGTDPLPGWGLDWGTEPATVPAAQMEYNHVGRSLSAGWAGAAGSVPASVSAGQVVTYTTSYTVPMDQDPYQMHAIGMLLDNGANRVVNAGKAVAAVNIEDIDAAFEVSVFPNPATTNVNIRVELPEAGTMNLEVLNMLGQVVVSKNYGTISGAQYAVLNVSDYEAGMYQAVITVDGKRVVKPFTVMK